MHIPLELYPFFLSSILQLFFHEVSTIDHHHHGDTPDSVQAERSQPVFLNFSITPVECSIMCPRQLAAEYLAPLIEQFQHRDPTSRDSLFISKDDYIAMQVVGVGLGACQRVLDLTSPLAMAGMYASYIIDISYVPINRPSRSIFFITTYFSDYIVVPLHSKTKVIEALQERGFQFEPSSSSAFITSPTTPPSTVPSPPSGPSNNSNITSLETLRRYKITPLVDRTLRLVHCAARYDDDSDPDPYNPSPSSSSSSLTLLLRTALTTSLLIDAPRFLSLTQSSNDQSASLLIEQRLVPRFVRPESAESLLLRCTDEIVPIILDLRCLPLEASGIVCSAAGRLAEATKGLGCSCYFYDDDDDGGSSGVWSWGCGSEDEDQEEEDVVCLSSLYCEDEDGEMRFPGQMALSEVDIGFLSTARAGTILVGRRQLKCAVEALEGVEVD